MNHLKYPQKFILISVIFALPTLLMMYLLFSELYSRIDFAQKELYGTEYLRPTSQILAAISNHQFLTYRNSLQTASPAELLRQQQAVDQGLKNLEKVEQKLGNILQTTPQYNRLKNTWKNLKIQPNFNKLETQIASYHTLISQIENLRSQVGNTSNLILDPDLDSYYAMSTTLINLPAIQQRLFQVKLLGKKMLIQRSNNSIHRELVNSEYTQLRAELIVLSGILQDAADQLEKEMNFAFMNNPSGQLKPKLESPVQNFIKSLQQQTKAIDQLINSDQNLLSLDYIQSTDQTLALSFQLWHQVVDELDVLLQRRIAGFAQKQQLILIFVWLVVLAVIYLFVGFYLAVMETVQCLEEASKKMTNGSPNYQIQLKSKDELAQVVHSFNNIAAALLHANQEVSQLNQRLKTENLRMSAELDITRKLQQMILPKEEELEQIQGLDIAGFMEPAAEVGGDYYDVLQQDGQVKISIGDVTGHGLESGVLMIMVQTAVRTLLANNETDPVKFLNALNSAIYGNVQRMNSDKNLTFSLLDYKEGVLNLSGQHEEIIVVRSGGKSERIDTIDLGFPIGLDSDIAPWIQSARLKLNTGDVVVLYTDGITEAEDIHKVQYGLERLIGVVKQHWEKSAAEIRQAVIEDVWHHIGRQKVYDDITLLILKQK